MKNKILFLSLSFWLLALSLVFAQAEKISLDLQGVDINELFKMLSQKSGLTIITTPDVQGRVTIFLNNLSFEDTLDVIVTRQNLAYERKDKVIKVMTAAEYEKNFGEKFGEKKEIKTIKLNYAKPGNIMTIISSLKSGVGKIIVDEPSGTLIIIDTPQAVSLIEETIKQLDRSLGTAVFDINYARSADIKAYLNDLITPGVGQVIIDERSNKAIVSDLPQRLVKITKLMKELDEESRQVLITGEIIEVSLKDSFSRGIDWEKAFSERRVAGLDFKGHFPTTLTNYQQVSVGTVAQNGYKTVLNFLQEYGAIHTLSQPRLVVVNKEEASILVGTRQPYVTTTQSQAQTTTVTAESIQFVDIGIKLKVTPTINKDGFITMKIKPEVSVAGIPLTTASGTKIPVVTTSEAESVVKVKDGTMIMIAGLIKEQKSDTITGEPWLSKVPILGIFFGNRIKTNPRTELVIFLTPQIISGAGPNKNEAKTEIKNSNDKIQNSK